MKNRILVRGARQLLTMHGPSGPRQGDALRELGLIEDGSVLIVDGIVNNVGPTRRVENLAQARDAEEINAAGQVVVPGFVDSNTHLISPPARVSHFRMAGENGHNGIHDAGSLTAALNYVRNTPAGTLEFNAARYLEACLRHGTTTLEAKTGYGLNAPGEMKMLRVLAELDERCVSVVPTFMGAHVVPPEYFGRANEYVSWLCSDMIPRLRDRKLAQFADVLCDPEAFDIHEARTYLDYARRAGLPVKIHAEQNCRTGASALGVEFEATSIDGLNHATEADAELIARSRSIATLLPAAVHQGSYSRFPPARMLIDAGAAVALATGFHPPVCSTFSMQMVISLACTHMGMSPEEAIVAATINGAYAAGRANKCGSLESGKAADLCILNISDYREIPFYFGCNLVSMVMRKGVVAYRDGVVTCAAE